MVKGLVVLASYEVRQMENSEEPNGKAEKGKARISRIGSRRLMGDTKNKQSAEGK